MKSLLLRCVDVVLLNLNFYNKNLQYLPSHTKDLILKRISQNHSFDSHKFDEIFIHLLHTETNILDMSFITLNNDRIKEICGCRQLSTLIIRQITADEENFIDVFQNFKNLTKLEIKNSDVINDKIICAILSACPKLVYLDIGGCKNITDDVLYSLVKYSKFIQAIDISNSEITTKGVLQFVLEYGPQLIDIRLDYCNRITIKAIHAIISYCPNIEMLSYLHWYTERTDEELSVENTKLKQICWTIPW